MLPPQMPCIASKLSSRAIPNRSDHRKDSAHMQHLELRQSQCPLRPAQSRLFNWAGPILLLTNEYTYSVQPKKSPRAFLKTKILTTKAEKQNGVDPYILVSFFQNQVQNIVNDRRSVSSSGDRSIPLRASQRPAISQLRYEHRCYVRK